MTKCARSARWIFAGQVRIIEDCQRDAEDGMRNISFKGEVVSEDYEAHAAYFRKTWRACEGLLMRWTTGRRKRVQP
jgi:hypothetical protein